MEWPDRGSGQQEDRHGDDVTHDQFGEGSCGTYEMWKGVEMLLKCAAA